MPKPIDRARQNLFDRDAVLAALGMPSQSGPPPEPERLPIKIDREAFLAARAELTRKLIRRGPSSK